MLDYKNDPLLLDKKTFNDLIGEKNENILFLDKESKILNLFSAFVKKSDFIKDHKLNQPLQKTVYVKVSKELIRILRNRCNKTNDIQKLIETYTKRRTNCRDAVNRWFVSGIFPFILLRILSKNNTEFSGWISEIRYFTDFLGKSKLYSPKTLSELLSHKLVYFVGCSVGDGHIDKNGKRWVLVDGSSDPKRLILSGEFVSNLSNLLSDYIDAFKIVKHKTKYELKVNNKLFCRFLNFFFGLPYGSKKEKILRVPLILKYSGSNLEKYFWRGCFDTDGSAVRSIGFCSSDKNLISQCDDYLKSLGIKVNLGKKNIRIPVPSLKEWTSIGFAHPRKQIEFLTTLKKGAKFKLLKIKEKDNVPYALRRIHRLLQVDRNGYRVRINSSALKEQEIPVQNVNDIMKKLFNCEFRQASNNLYYFKSKKVYSYLRSIFIYEPAWQAINDDEEEQFLCNWNDVWRK